MSASAMRHGGPQGESDALLPVRIDCSTSVNAYGPAAIVTEAILQSCAPRTFAPYPDPECWKARSVIAESLGLDVVNVQIGAGAAELIHAICAAFIQRGDTVLIPGLAFSEYARMARMFGARVVVTASAEQCSDLLTISTEASAAVFCDAIRTYAPKLAFLCSPENPTGRAWSADDLRRVFETCVATDTILVLDQAYDAFTVQPLGTPVLPLHDRVIHVRSLTKDHALAGVRVAYSVATGTVAKAIEAVRIPWSVSTAAQAAAIATATDAARMHVQSTTAQLRASAALLMTECAAHGFGVTHSDTHYFVASVPRGIASAVALRDDLWKARGIKVRDCESFGLPNHIRIAAQTETDTTSIIDSLRATVARLAPTR